MILNRLPSDYHQLPITKKINYAIVGPAHFLNEARVHALHARESSKRVPDLFVRMAWLFLVCADKLLLAGASSYSRRIQKDDQHMRKIFAFLTYAFPLAMLIAFARVAFAQDVPASLPTDPAGILGFFKQMHETKEWSLLIGGVITLLVRLLTLLKPLAEKLPPEATKWLAMALAMLGSIATGLMAKIPWYKVLLDGIQVGTAAMGGWEFILKPILGKLGLSKNPVGPVSAPTS